jgi:hypothetical protein
VAGGVGDGRPALRAFLGGHRYGVLATGRPDGRTSGQGERLDRAIRRSATQQVAARLRSKQPRDPAPIAYFLAAGDVWFATVAGARLRNVGRVPYASFVVSEGEGDDHRAVRIEGGVTVHEPTAELCDRWRDWHGSSPDWAVTFLRLEADRVLSFAARAGD